MVPGDYEKCVTNFYQSHVNWPQVTVVDTLTPPEGNPPVGGVAAWDSTKVYVKDDKVSFNNVIYVAKWWTQGDSPETANGPWSAVN